MAFIWFVPPMSFFARIPYDVIRSAIQRKSLQSRSDFPEIAAACVSLAGKFPSEYEEASGTDQRVPPLLKTLSPNSIFGSSQRLGLEFHGGFDHYGYTIRQSESDVTRWTLYFYTEQGMKELATITHE